MQAATYIIRGGVEGRERLRILSRVMRPTTLALFDRIGLRPAMACLDAGCGGGDVTCDLAQAVGPGGKVVGLDIDEPQLRLARREAGSLGLGNLEFRQAEIGAADLEPAFDVAYARFLLSHLNDPLRALAKMRQALRPGGVLVVEDVDFTGHFCHPDSPAFRRYVELYTLAARLKGADPNIGPRLPGLLIEVGCERLGMNVVQPAGAEGDVKLLTPITMENIAGAVLEAGLASRAEVDQVIGELYAFAQDPHTVMSVPRVVQAWGYREGNATP